MWCVGYALHFRIFNNQNIGKTLVYQEFYQLIIQKKAVTKEN